MAVDTQRIRQHLDRQELAEVFIGELGWDNPPPGAEPVVVSEDEIAAEQIADKRGVGVWLVRGIHSSPAMRRLDVAVSRFTRERLLVFADDDKQLWLWPEQRVSGAGYRLMEHPYYPGARNDALIQRLGEAAFTIEEEGTLTVIDVLQRVRRSFNVDDVTKPFYREFKQHHDDLLDQLEGITDGSHKSWYASVLLNRLMFIYFMQKKGFLDDDSNYLRTRLERVRHLLGSDAFYGFFREFLLPLFHDGLGSDVHEYADPEIARIIGDVPFVNGGIFSAHDLERRYEIGVPDRAFEAIFDFFDRYKWHLDERPSEDPNEINPDVLGYIFEQYVNQKAQGAYYTKEDVTRFMTASTVFPALIDKLGNPEDLWKLLTTDPDRYIWESVRHGATEVLPKEISAGLHDDSGRTGWSAKAPASYGLPGETWWEALDRHQRYRELREQLEVGGVVEPNEAVTANLDLKTLLEDHLRMLGSVDDLEEAWAVVSSLTILDPTCGSGAFLFAALEILSDVYDALVDRAIEISSSLGSASFLRSMSEHPNRHYFVMKCALLSNLFGVDIMYEAGEIARLRLFLKLAAQLNHRSEIEPLPDLDFNIKTGNLLVGVAHVDDAEQRLAQDLIGLSRLGDVVAAAEEAAGIYDDFVRSQQQSDDHGLTTELKVTMSEKLGDLRDQLDRLLFAARGEAGDFAAWLESHQPFHWFIEFPGVFLNGGFDVVVGNPPYIARNRITRYSYKGLVTDDLPDIYAPCLERALVLMNRTGRFTMILPISFQFSDEFRIAREVADATLSQKWVSAFSRNPAALFSAGLGVRSTILIGSAAGDRKLAVSRLNRWVDDYRPYLFETLAHWELSHRLQEFGWPRLQNDRCGELFNHLLECRTSVGDVTLRSSETTVRFKTTALYYLSVFREDPPSFDVTGNPISQTKIGSLAARSLEDANALSALLLSKIALAWWASTSDDFDVTAKGLSSTPLGRELFGETEWALLSDLGREILETMKAEVIYTKYAGKWMGNYDVKRVRRLTDQVDAMILRHLGLSSYWSDLELFYAGFMKATGERPGTLRSLPEFGR